MCVFKLLPLMKSTNANHKYSIAIIIIICIVNADYIAYLEGAIHTQLTHFLRISIVSTNGFGNCCAKRIRVELSS